MVEFDPRFTQVVYLDTEWYVPPSDRKPRQGSLVVNPARAGHFLLGGVFARDFPLEHRRLPLEEIWGFSETSEDETLHSVYRLFQRAWAELEGRSPEHPDLVVVGIGVARFDLPALFVRCLLRNIAPAEPLYEAFLNTKVVDLSDSELGILSRGGPILYPRTANELKHGRVGSRPKPSGKRVWQLFDDGEYEAIQARTRGEVEDILVLAHQLTEERRAGRPGPDLRG